MEKRREAFKRSVSSQSGAEHRRRVADTMRRHKKDKALASKRRKMDPQFSSQEDLTTISNERVSELVQNAVNLPGLKFLRAFMSAVENENIATLAVEENVIPLLIRHLTSSNEEQQYEAAWCITNIAHGTHEQTEAALEAAPYLIQFLRSSSPLLQEQAAWALGNIAGDCTDFRDKIRANGALLPLLDLLYNKKTFSTAAWALCNLARGPNANIKEFFGDDHIVPILVRLLDKESYEDLEDVVWLLSYLTSDHSEAAVLVSGSILPPLCKHMCSLHAEISSGLRSNEVFSRVVLLRTLGNIISGENQLTDTLISVCPDITSILVSILLEDGTKASHAERKESAWALSNFCGGSTSHVDYLVNNGYVPSLVSAFLNSDFVIKQELGYALANLCADGRHLGVVCDAGALAGFLRLTTWPDVDVVMLGMQFVEICLYMLDNGVAFVEEKGGIGFLENLLYHEYEGVRTKATKLVDVFYTE